jgi:hypothetical protein
MAALADPLLLRLGPGWGRRVLKSPSYHSESHRQLLSTGSCSALAAAQQRSVIQQMHRTLAGWVGPGHSARAQQHYLVGQFLHTTHDHTRRNLNVEPLPVPLAVGTLTAIDPAVPLFGGTARRIGTREARPQQ